MVFDRLLEKFDIKSVSNLFLLMQHSTFEEAVESEVGGVLIAIFLTSC